MLYYTFEDYGRERHERLLREAEERRMVRLATCGVPGLGQRALYAASGWLIALGLLLESASKPEPCANRAV